MNLEIMKEKFLKNEDLSHEELLIILEDIIETALRNGKFDNNKKAFYTKQNYTLTLNALLENQIEIPSHLNFKKDNADRLAKIEYTKQFRSQIYGGIFFLLFPLIIWYIFKGMHSYYIMLAMPVQGLILLIVGIKGLKNLK